MHQNREKLLFCCFADIDETVSWDAQNQVQNFLEPAKTLLSLLTLAEPVQLSFKKASRINFKQINIDIDININMFGQFLFCFDFRQIDRRPPEGVRGSFLSVLGRFPGLFHRRGLENRPFFSKIPPNINISI